MKLLIALGTAAILTAACTASASVSGSSASTVKTANTVHVVAGANAGSDVQGELDVNRVNPLVGKAGSHQAPPLQVVPLAPAAAPAQFPAFGIAQDRCGGMIGNPPAGHRGVGPAGTRKLMPLPACLAE